MNSLGICLASDQAAVHTGLHLHPTLGAEEEKHPHNLLTILVSRPARANARRSKGLKLPASGAGEH